MRVVTFGEIMMRLATPGRLRFSQAKELELTFGGGEANVAVSLANFGLPRKVRHRPPQKPIADATIAELRVASVSTLTQIVRGPEPPRNLLPRNRRQPTPQQSRLRPRKQRHRPRQTRRSRLGTIFDNAAWFHITGITPAIGSTAADLSAESMQKAPRAADSPSPATSTTAKTCGNGANPPPPS